MRLKSASVRGAGRARRARELWTRPDVVLFDAEPKGRALAAGMQVVSNRCIRTEHKRPGIPPK